MKNKSAEGYFTLAEASEKIKEKKLSPVELTDMLLKRIVQYDGKVNSFITVTEEKAIAQAHKAESDIIKGNWKSLLHGIPLGIKDIIDTAGTLTSCHSAIHKHRIPQKDATVITKLEAAGAISLGKTATWEFAIGGTSFDLPWPPAKNPWDVERDPAGSSSGSAAAVAAGFCLGALGTDTGGSIRGPSAWCGIAGMKPTYGLVSRHGVAPLSFSQDHVGPMCWTVEDCAIMLQTLAGHDPADPASAPSSEVNYVDALKGDVRGLRIGVVRHFFEQDSVADSEVVSAFENALQFFRESGFKVKDVKLSPLQVYFDVGGIIERAESFSVHEFNLTHHPELYGAYGRKRIGAGAFVQSSDYLNALRLRKKLVRQVADVMREVDVLVMPTRGTVAVPLAGYDMQLNVRQIYTRPFNVTGLPALSLCSGFSKEGLPLAIQIVARPFEDALALMLGHFLESNINTRSVRPAL